MSKKYNKYMRNTTRTVAINTTELVGIKIGGSLVGSMGGGPGSAIGNQALGTGFGLAGTTGLVNTAGGVLDSLNMLSPSTKKRKKR